jgi:hypothetical protein
MTKRAKKAKGAKKAKKAVKKAAQPALSIERAVNVQPYPCRCYALIDGGYHKYVYNPRTGLYEGPADCTEEECRQCNMSHAQMIT